MAGLQKKPSATWAIGGSASVGGGKGKVGAGIIVFDLIDVESQLFIPVVLKGGSLGGGLPVGLTASCSQPTFFETSKPLWAEAFHTFVTVAGAELTIGVGGALAVMTFTSIDHDPYWLGIGGLQVGISGGIAAGLYRATPLLGSMKANNGCNISPDGDPLCGGSSSAGPNSSPGGVGPMSTPSQGR
jgi:hypothetical protein